MSIELNNISGEDKAFFEDALKKDEKYKSARKNFFLLMALDIVVFLIVCVYLILANEIDLLIICILFFVSVILPILNLIKLKTLRERLFERLKRRRLFPSQQRNLFEEISQSVNDAKKLNDKISYNEDDDESYAKLTKEELKEIEEKEDEELKAALKEIKQLSKEDRTFFENEWHKTKEYKSTRKICLILYILSFIGLILFAVDCIYDEKRSLIVIPIALFLVPASIALGIRNVERTKFFKRLKKTGHFLSKSGSVHKEKE